MTKAWLRTAALLLVVLMAATAVFAGASITGPVDDAYAAKAGGVE